MSTTANTGRTRIVNGSTDELTSDEVDALRGRLESDVLRLRSASGDDVDARTRAAGRLAEATRVLGKIDDGTYGACETCNGPIATERLFAFPRATLCLACQAERDRISA